MWILMIHFGYLWEKKKGKENGEKTYVWDSKPNIEFIRGKENLAIFTSTQEALKAGNVNMHWSTKSSSVHMIMG